MLNRCADVLAALQASERPDGADFALTGTVAATLLDNNLILWDGHDSLFLRCRDKPIPVQPPVGSRVIVCGYLGREMFGAVMPYVREIVRLGTGDVPPPSDFDEPGLDAEQDACTHIRLRGVLVDRYPDDIDLRLYVLILKTAGGIVNCLLPAESLRASPVPDVNATIEVDCWRVPVISGRRIFRDAYYAIADVADIRILQAPPDDAFAVPDIESLHHVSPATLARAGRHRAVGTVIAVWRDRHVLVRTDAGRIVRATLASAVRPPTCGTHLCIAGYPRTDLYRVNFAYAVWKPVPGSPFVGQEPKEIVPADILGDCSGTKTGIWLHGTDVRLTGAVASLSESDRANGRLIVICDGTPVAADASSCPEALSSVIPGSVVSVSGICLVETDEWSPDNPLPRIRGFSVILRDPAALAIVSTPPWWTPFRLIVVICTLLALLLGALVWTRILGKVVARRSRQLLKAEIGKVESDLRVGERTRLALELHDSIAQILTGVGFQIEAAESTLATDRTSCAGFLSVAKKTLLSCREELRRCLWDLRGPALEERDFDQAVRMTLEPVTDCESVSVKTGIDRSVLSDLTAHALLCAIRELTVNAFRHGKANKVAISGSQKGSHLTVTVADDGSGFDPKDHPGPSEGHFGLQGVAERIARVRGRLSIESRPGAGTRITLEIHA